MCKFLESDISFHKVKIDKKSLTIEKNPNEQSIGNYSCYGDSDPQIDTDLLLCLKITGEHFNPLTSLLIVFPIKSVFYMIC